MRSFGGLGHKPREWHNNHKKTNTTTEKLPNAQLSSERKIKTLQNSFAFLTVLLYAELLPCVEFVAWFAFRRALEICFCNYDHLGKINKHTSWTEFVADESTFCSLAFKSLCK